MADAAADPETKLAASQAATGPIIRGAAAVVGEADPVAVQAADQVVAGRARQTGKIWARLAFELIVPITYGITTRLKTQDVN